MVSLTLFPFPRGYILALETAHDLSEHLMEMMLGGDF